MADAITLEDARDEVIELVAEMLAKRWSKSRIKRALTTVNGKRPTAKTIDDLVRDAQAYIRVRAGISLSVQLELSVAFYESIISDDAVPLQDKLTAQARLEKLIGIGAKDGRDTSPSDKARQIQEAMAKMRDSVPGVEDE